MMDVVEILHQLVSISSISRESNRGVVAFAEGLLAQAGWAFEEYAYRDPLGVEKVNLVAWPRSLSSEKGRFHLALVCHTDTVPYGPEWTDATKLIAEGDNLRGCGACDVKGFLACILAAVAKLDISLLRRSICVIFTADEEVGCVGVRHLVDQQVLSLDFAIIGEPTSLRPVRAGKGYCLAEVVVHGREAHSAFPEAGESAVFRAARLIVEIERIAEELKSSTVDGFFPPWTTLNIGEVHGGVAKNIIAPSCRFLLEWRPIPGQEPDLVPELVRGAVRKLTEADANFCCDVSVLRQQEGFAVNESSELVQAFLRASSKPTGFVAFGTEAPWLGKMGAEAIVFGPGSMQSAHSPREFVPRGELTRCVEILTEVVQELCR